MSGLPALADNRSQLLNEIMPMIYKRFTEKSAEEWRQIYKVMIATWNGWRALTNTTGTPINGILDQERLRAGH